MAFGGVGKSVLVAEWLKRLGKDNWRGAMYIVGHSFYSQGSRESTQVSAEPFIDKALRLLGDMNPEEGSAWDKGERLAQLARIERTLLVLDGVEPLQNGPVDGDAGRIKDPSLSALVRELEASNTGLCVITTRLALADISAAPTIKLDHLPPTAGASLLKDMGVHGTQLQLEEASQKVGGHGLALSLLGTFLCKACDSDVNKIGELDLIEVDSRQGGYASKIIEKYEHWFGESAELSILRLLGLFDRPADLDILKALRKAPVIISLTDTLIDISDSEWAWAVTNLSECGLAVRNISKSETFLDAHPLVREYFAKQLETQTPEAARQAHSRIYQYLKKTSIKLPSSLQDMMPLYQAISHGCKAGRFQETLTDIYWTRIRRKDEAFSVKMLGAFSLDLVALSSFFEIRWSKPETSLLENWKAELLNYAGFRLYGLGRINEAIDTMNLAFLAHLEQENWYEASNDASNLSQFYLLLGKLKYSAKFGRKGVKLAEKSKDSYSKMVRRTDLADALHQAGKLKASEQLFREAESLLIEPEQEYLFSLWGYRFCELLLTLGYDKEVIKRSKYTLENWSKPKEQLLAIALDYLSLANANMILAKSDQNAYEISKGYFSKAINMFRQSGYQNFLVKGLLFRAELFCELEEYTRASHDLEEAYKLSERSNLKLLLADYHIKNCNLQLKLSAIVNCKRDNIENINEAKKHYLVAKQLVHETGYYRRNPELSELLANFII